MSTSKELPCRVPAKRYDFSLSFLKVANPKSVNLTCPVSVSSMFSGFRSLYITFSLVFKYSSANTTSAATNLTTFSGNPLFLHLRTL